MGALTLADRDRLSALHSAGLSLSEIARQLSCSPSTVGKWASRAGLEFSRENTMAATAAKQADNAARRVLAGAGLLDDLDGVRARLTPDLAPRDLRDVAVAVGCMARAHADLSKIDPTTEPVMAQHQSMLANLISSLTAAVELDRAAGGSATGPPSAAE